MHKTACTETDFLRLSALAKAVKRSAKPERAAVLDTRLRDAIVFTGDLFMEKVVTMNSIVRIREPHGAESFTYRLAFPGDADIARGFLSVLTPLGAALIGRHEGEVFSYASPGGVSRMLVESVERAEPRDAGED